MRYIEWHIYKRRLCRIARKTTIDKAPSDGRCSSWNLKAFVRRNWRRACFLYTNKWNSIHWSNQIGVSDRQTPFLSGNILQQNGDRAGRHYPPAIFVAGAQRDARVLHCKNPVHSAGAPRRLNGYLGWDRYMYLDSTPQLFLDTNMCAFWCICMLVWCQTLVVNWQN